MVERHIGTPKVFYTQKRGKIFIGRQQMIQDEWLILAWPNMVEIAPVYVYYYISNTFEKSLQTVMISVRTGYTIDPIEESEERSLH